MTVKGHAKIMNEAGIHCRPSTHIIKTMQGYSGRILVIHAQNGECDLSSMLDLMMLGLTCGSEVDIEVEGPDEATQLSKIVELFEYKYDFPNAGM
jgi:phosphocarrier protein HPr